MHAGRSYSLPGILLWTRRETAVFAVLAVLPYVMDLLAWAPPKVPWAPLAAVGTAVAFVTGLKGNAAYGRLWEARQIWGGIVNTSRTWTILVQDFIVSTSTTQDLVDAARTALIRRHLAWITALRYQLREPRAWETSHLPANAEYRARTFTLPEAAMPVDAALAAFADPADLARVSTKKNRAIHLIALQSKQLRELVEAGCITEYRHAELMRTLSLLYDHQGKCERLKNFPYPRQFATINLVFVWVFISLLPFAMHPEFVKIGASPGLAVALSVVVSWVFHTMDKIGSASENPFEGGPNDVPISAMCRGIEIDLLEMTDATEVPPALQPINGILM